MNKTMTKIIQPLIFWLAGRDTYFRGLRNKMNKEIKYGCDKCKDWFYRPVDGIFCPYCHSQNIHNLED